MPWMIVAAAALVLVLVVCLAAEHAPLECPGCGCLTRDTAICEYCHVDIAALGAEQQLADHRLFDHEPGIWDVPLR